MKISVYLIVSVLDIGWINEKSSADAEKMRDVV